MLQLVIAEKELFDEKTNEFIKIPETVLSLEHSLVSVSKWESKWKIPFIGKREKTNEQILDYIKFMTITQNVDPMVYEALESDEIKKITDYISDPMTATWFNEKDSAKKGNPGKEITSELIYYWMISCEIPFECQKWHLNRLLTLIRVCSAENKPAKKMSKKDLLSRNAALNAARRSRTGSRG